MNDKYKYLKMTLKFAFSLNQFRSILIFDVFYFKVWYFFYSS